MPLAKYNDNDDDDDDNKSQLMQVDQQGVLTRAKLSIVLYSRMLSEINRKWSSVDC